ncbi:MAG: hypothetical protein NXY59_02560 [Aigarchaeota archaeon]|nr:hypothetical protein [Candidatus Pelearchaeum maunauluense]
MTQENRWGLLPTLVGRSGIVHEFTEIVSVGNDMRVIDQLEYEADENDILRLYLKMLDVGIREAELKVPGITEQASKLATMYNIKVTIVGRASTALTRSRDQTIY